MHDSQNIHYPCLIIIRGLPGSGKTHVATALANKIGVDRCVLLDPDAIPYDSGAYKKHCETLAAEGVEEKYFPYRYLRALAFDAIEQQKCVIWNQAFTLLGGLHRTVASLTEHAEAHHHALPYLIAEVEIDKLTAQNRIKDRVAHGGHDVTAESFKRFVADYRSVKDEFTNVISIDGTQSVDISAAMIINKLI